MPKEMNLNISVTKVELEFIQYCRNLGHGKLTITLVDGEPKKAEQIVKSCRFDLTSPTNKVQ